MDQAVAVVLPPPLRESSPGSSSDVDGSNASSMPTPASPSLVSQAKSQGSLERPETKMQSESGPYIAVGVLRKRNAEYSMDGSSSGRELDIDSDDFPEPEVANLEMRNWIRTSSYVYTGQPEWCHVRVYVLPDDVCRMLIQRSSPPLRRALKVVMARIDQSIDAWEGRRLANGVDSKTVVSDGSEDESLWYIFNTLQDPDPNVENMKDPYARRAMEDLLSTPINDSEQGYSGVVGLKSTLYPYQRRSAATMVQREAQPAQVLDPRLQRFIGPSGREYYYDKEEGSLVSEKRLYSEACGGILAETMGCGKTLICLALILATRGHFPRIPAQYQETMNPVREKTASLVEMSAAAAGRFSVPWKSYFDTLSQLGMSYGRCIEACERNRGEYSIPPPQSRHRRKSMAYPSPAAQHLRLCSGTLVVVPANLVEHWEHEIAHHTEGLKVLTLRNSSDPTPSPDELLQYDILLFSKLRFEKEAGEVSEYQESPGKDTGDSPLMKLHWLRIIVDEGHNVAGHGQRNNMTQVLDRLQVERRWVVSGTPSTGLYGVEVSLASQETVTTDTDLPEATSSLLRGRKKTGNAINNELKDLDKLRLIVVDFLDLKPWSNSRADDRARWAKYVKIVDETGKRRKSPSLRATLQSLVVRHRLDVVHQEIPLPRLHNKVVYLEPTFYDRLSINLFLFGLAVNAITSGRKDQDYMFHPRNRKHLSLTVSNLRQAGFWWAGSDKDIPATIESALGHLEKNRDTMSPADVELLTEGVRIARIAISSSSRSEFVQLQELGVYVQNFPSHARATWALDLSRPDAEPLLLGISQIRMAQQFITSNLTCYDPAEGLAGAGIRARRELTERAGVSPNNASESGSARKSNNSSPEKIIKTKPSSKSPRSKTFTKGLYKTLSPESPLTQTRLVGTSSAKLSYLLSKVLEFQKTEKIIIFYDNSNSAFWIAEGLDVLGIQFRIYAGTLRAYQKAEYLSLFRESEDIRVLLMDLRQASHGLHLANASRVFIINPIWQPNVESQAIKRAHRIGQTRPVFVETLVLKDTLEDKILKRRKEMTDTEIQDAERDLLDDNIMNSIIQNEIYIPMTGDEEFAGPALLLESASLFGRHKLPVPDDGDVNSSLDNGGQAGNTKLDMRRAPSINWISPTKQPRKRKQVALALDAIPQIQSDLEPNPDFADLVKPKRKRTMPSADFVSEKGIVMTPTSRYRRNSRRSSALPAISANGSSSGQVSPSINSPALYPTSRPAPVYLGNTSELFTSGSSSNASSPGMGGHSNSVLGPFD